MKYVSYSRIEKRSLLISKKNIVIAYVLILLNLPGAVIDCTTIYHTEHTFALGNFAQLNYNMTIFDLLLILSASLIIKRKSNDIKMLPILFFVLLKDVFLALAGEVSPFTYNSYEMYLSFILGFSTCEIVCKTSNDSVVAINKYLDGLIVINLCYQVLFLLAGKGGDSGRVTSMSMGYGSVGYICALHIMYSLLLRKKDEKLLVIIGAAFVSILLSGSRFNLLVTLIGIFVFSSYIFQKTSPRIRIIIIGLLVLLIIPLIFLMMSKSIQEKYPIIQRMLGLFDSGNLVKNVGSDQSFTERMLSLTAGYQILVRHPMGISNSFIDMQAKTIEQGFYAFPHSNVLSYYLLWGPAFVFCIWWILKKIRMALYYKKPGTAYFLLFFLVGAIVYGGVETAPKVYSYVFCVFSAIKIQLTPTANVVNGSYKVEYS